MIIFIRNLLTIPTIFLMGLLIGCVSQNQSLEKIDLSSDITIFPETYDISFVLLQDLERYVPSDQDVSVGLITLRTVLEGNSSIRNLDEYKVQFFGYLSQEGEKVLWANYFCDTHGLNEKTSLIFVEDGGNCYFNVKVNLNTNEVFDLEVNGNA